MYRLSHPATKSAKKRVRQVQHQRPAFSLSWRESMLYIQGSEDAVQAVPSVEQKLER